MMLAATAGLLAGTPGARADDSAWEKSSGIWIDVGDRQTVAFAYLHSPTFRQVFDRARANPNIVVRLSSVPPQLLQGRAVLGNTRWMALPEITQRGARVTYLGVIQSRSRVGPLREVAARMAHELAHANELARYGSIRRAPGFRASGSDANLAETEPAIAIGYRVRAELQPARPRRMSDLEITAALAPTRPEAFPGRSSGSSEDVLITAMARAPSESWASAAGLAVPPRLD